MSPLLFAMVDAVFSEHAARMPGIFGIERYLSALGWWRSTWAGNF